MKQLTEAARVLREKADALSAEAEHAEYNESVVLIRRSSLLYQAANILDGNQTAASDLRKIAARLDAESANVCE